MEITLNYGREGLHVNLPEAVEILRTRYQPGIPDEARAIQESLLAPIASPPLGSLVKPGDRVTVVHTDITRATPNDRILPVIIDALHQAGVGTQDITLLNGLGTHRKQTDAELRSML
jgi:nickel-dependent lactate racemase